MGKSYVFLLKKQERSNHDPKACWVKTVSKIVKQNKSLKKWQKITRKNVKKLQKKLSKKFAKKLSELSQVYVTVQKSPRNLRAQWYYLNLKFWPWFQTLKAPLALQGGSKLKNEIKKGTTNVFVRECKFTVLRQFSSPQCLHNAWVSKHVE